MTARLDGALASARRFVQETHPDASASVLAGSVAAGRGSDTSDLDIVIYYDAQRLNYAETFRYGDWLVETFVYGPEGIDEWFAREAAQRRPVALDMWANGIPLTGKALADSLRMRAAGIIAGGPDPLDPEELANLRYGLTAAIEDLDGASGRAEEFAIVADVFKRSADLLLLSIGTWLGTGKWIVRRLADVDDCRAEMLVGWANTAERSPRELHQIARTVLDIAGGPLQEGHIRGTK